MKEAGAWRNILRCCRSGSWLLTSSSTIIIIQTLRISAEGKLKQTKFGTECETLVSTLGPV